LVSKFLICLAAIAACSAVALTAVAGARDAASTDVTIKYNGDGFQGKVKSDKSKCESDRKVNVYKKTSNGKQKLFSDTSDENGKWNTGNSGQASGKFFAKAKSTNGCEAGKSDVIHV
jgi:hypothetical protein